MFNGSAHEAGLASCPALWPLFQAACRRPLAAVGVRRAPGVHGGLGYRHCGPGIVADRVGLTLLALAYQLLASISERARTAGSNPHVCPRGTSPGAARTGHPAGLGPPGRAFWRAVTVPRCSGRLVPA